MERSFSRLGTRSARAATRRTFILAITQASGVPGGMSSSDGGMRAATRLYVPRRARVSAAKS